MATSTATMDYLQDQLSDLLPLTTRKMFGEYCVYLSGRPVGFVCDDQLYLKITPAGRQLAPQLPEGIPYPEARPHLLVTADLWEDRAWLADLLAATDRDLPIPTRRRSERLGA